jgi:RNA polymerase sigma-B factor
MTGNGWTAMREPFEDLDAAAMLYARRSTSVAVDARAGLRAQFAAECLPFAGRLARRYRGRGEPVEDLEQVARLGLLKAIDRYEPGRGSFTAYAVVTICGEIKRHFRDRTWAVHVPRAMQDLNLSVRHATGELTGDLARTPTEAEIAGYLGVSEYDVVRALGSGGGHSPVSLNMPVTGGDGRAELGDVLGVVDRDLELVEDRITISGLLLRLPARERRMLALRFYGSMTQAEIAAEMGISQMHVSRLLTRTLTWLREAMLTDRLPRWEGADLVSAQRGLEIFARRADGDVQTVRVRGEVDRDTAGRLRTALRQAVDARPARVVVDLSGVGVVDAGGVAALADVAAAARAATVDLRLSGVRPYVLHILKVSGLADLMTVG